MYAFARLPLLPSGLVTVIPTAPPPGCSGMTAVMTWSFTTVASVAVPLSTTVAPIWNPEPLMVTGVPPLAEPVVGEIDVTTGTPIGVGAGGPSEQPRPCTAKTSAPATTRCAKRFFIGNGKDGRE